MTPIERIARALCARDRYYPDAVDLFDDGSPKGSLAWRAYVGRAGCALEAMREPSIEMLSAGWACLQEGRNTNVRLLGPGNGLKEAFGAMIDAALREGAP